jgi:hypothetical protein
MRWLFEKHQRSFVYVCNYLLQTPFQFDISMAYQLSIKGMSSWIPTMMLLAQSKRSLKHIYTRKKTFVPKILVCSDIVLVRLVFSGRKPITKLFKKKEGQMY